MKYLVVAILIAWFVTGIAHVSHYHKPYVYRDPITIKATVTGYTASPEETDSTPTTTASNQQVRDGIVACPSFLDFGRKVKIKGTVYECQDVMNQRYRDKAYFDIFFWRIEDAINFGRQELEIELL